MSWNFTSASLFALLWLGGCATAPPDVTPDQVVALGLPNAMSPSPEIVVTGQFSEPQLRELAKLGPVRIVNLRAAGEPGTDWEPALTQELGMTYVHLPITGEADLTEANARRFAEILDERSAGTLDLVHCGSGNRVGALFALKAFYVDGASTEAALAFGKQAGMTRLEPAVAKKLSQ